MPGREKCRQPSLKADEKRRRKLDVRESEREGKREEERDIIETSNIQILWPRSCHVSLRHVFPFAFLFSPSLSLSLFPRYFTFDLFSPLSLSLSRATPEGLKRSKRISVGSAAVRDHGRASPRFTAKLPFHDWQPVNDSMLEQSLTTVIIIRTRTTRMSVVAWYTTPNRISRRTDFCHRLEPPLHMIPGPEWRFWLISGGGDCHDENVGNRRKRHCHRHCCNRASLHPGFTWIMFRQRFHVSFGMLERKEGEGGLTWRGLYRGKWKVSIRFFGAGGKDWNRFEILYAQKIPSFAVLQEFLSEGMSFRNRVSGRLLLD